MLRQPISVTVVGGYLGAGKTTLVNSVLRGDHGRRIAVLVNDFGSVNIDAALIAHHEGATVELTNGCACCSMGDGVAEAFYSLLERDIPFDHVLVEASGVADPRKLAGWASLPGFCLDGVVVLADAETIQERVRDRYVGAIVERQLAGADLLVITKADLVTAVQLAAVRSWLTETHQDAMVLASLGALSFEVLTGLEGRSHEALADSDAHADVHVGKTLYFDAPLDRARFDAAFSSAPDGLLRAKGFCRFASAPDEVCTVHVVGRRMSVTSDNSARAADIDGVLTVIGVRGVFDVDALHTRLVP